jgi:hypothetical protein
VAGHVRIAFSKFAIQLYKIPVAEAVTVQADALY